MRYLLGILLSAALLSGAACSKAPPHSPGIPLAEIEPKVVDLGRLDVAPGASKEGEFRIANRGTGTLNLIGLESSCGCTVPKWPTPSIPPGGEVAVRLRVEPRNDSGAHGSLVTIRTDDPAHPVISVNVRWIEQLAITFEPKGIDFGWLESGKTTEAKVSVQLSSRIAPESLKLQCRNPCLSLAWEAAPGPSPGDDSESRTRTLRIRLDPERDREARAAEVRLMSGDEQFAAKLPITWRSGPPLEVSPKAIFQSEVPAGTRVESRIIVRSADGKPRSVRAAELDGQPLAFSEESAGRAQGSSSIIAFSIRSGESPGIEKHTVRLFVGESPKDVLTVPVTFVVR